MVRSQRLFSSIGPVVAVVVFLAGAGHAFAAGDSTCWGGSISSGAYSNLSIAGACTVDAGSVNVEHNLTVLPGASLVAITGGAGQVTSSDLTVGGNLDVKANAVLVLGCEPIFYPCANDPDQVVGTFSTKHSVGGNLTAENALSVLVHHSTIGRNISVDGGGGGISSCSQSLAVLGGAPPYGDFEDLMVGGNIIITGWHSCWLGMLRDHVMHNVNFEDNATGDPDGNEMANNSIGGNLNCSGNTPLPQIGDSGGGLSTVFGRANGQCNNPKLVH